MVAGRQREQAGCVCAVFEQAAEMAGNGRQPAVSRVSPALEDRRRCCLEMKKTADGPAAWHVRLQLAGWGQNPLEAGSPSPTLAILGNLYHIDPD
jgi:hypothetical protein